MGFLQVSLVIKQQFVDQVEELLNSLGAISITLNECGDESIFEPPPGEMPIWENSKLTSLFEKSDNNVYLLEVLKERLPEQAYSELKLIEIEDKDWTREWMDDFKPMLFGDNLWIIPSSHSVVSESAVNILLDPGLAFGTGTHPTTALCLNWLDKNPPKNIIVIDFGCGSGILAIAAAKLGANRVYAIDIDPQALVATMENARKNGVENKIECTLVENAKSEMADLLLANILANPLIELAQNFSNLLNSGADIVLSGVLESQGKQVLGAYQSLFKMNPAQQKLEWLLLSGKKI